VNVEASQLLLRRVLCNEIEAILVMQTHVIIKFLRVVKLYLPFGFV